MTQPGYRPCAGVVLVNPAGLVFAGRRNDRPSTEPAAWQLPQGGVDEGEDIVTAALRELETHSYLRRFVERLPGGKVVTRTLSYARPEGVREAVPPEPVRPPMPATMPLNMRSTMAERIPMQLTAATLRTTKCTSNTCRRQRGRLLWRSSSSSNGRAHREPHLLPPERRRRRLLLRHRRRRRRHLPRKHRHHHLARARPLRHHPLPVPRGRPGTML